MDMGSRLLSEAEVQYRKTLQHIYISIRHRPRGSNTLLIVFAFFRALAVVGILIRLDMFSNELMPQRIPQPKEMFAFLSVLYAVGLLVLFLIKPSYFYSQASKGFQIVSDIALFSFAYVMTGDSRSDIYFLNIMPLLVAVEYFSLSVVASVLASILLLHIAFFTMLAEQRPLGEWLIRDYVPRMFVVTVIGLAYIVHRRLLPPADGMLADERESIIRQAKTAVETQNKEDIRKLEDQLRHYLESVEWSRRLFTRQATSLSDDYALQLLAVINEQSSSETHDAINPDTTIGKTIDSLAQMLNCCAATLRMQESRTNSKDVLVLVYAYRCAALTEAGVIKELPVSSESIVAKSFKTRRILRYPSNQKDFEPLQLQSVEFAKVCNLRSVICVPIELGDRRGVLSLYRQVAQPFAEPDQHLILTAMDNLAIILASRIAIGLRTQSIERLERRLKSLWSLAADFPSSQTESELMNKTVLNIRSQLRVEVASVFLMRGEHLRRKADAGIERSWFQEEAYLPGDGITGQTFITQEAFKLVNNVKENPSVRRDNLRRYSQRLKSGAVEHIIVVPIEGQRARIGVLRVINKLDEEGKIDSAGFTHDDAETLAILGYMLGTAIESLRQMTQINLLLSLAKEVNQSIDNITSVYNSICRSACAILNADQSGIIMCDSAAHTAVVEAQVRKVADSFGDTSYENRNVSNLPPLDLCNSSLMDCLKRDRRPLPIHDTSSSKCLHFISNLLRDDHIESCLILPLIIQGEIVGALSIDSIALRREFKEDEIRIAELVASIGSQGIEAAQIFSAAGRFSRDAERRRITDDLHDLRGLFGSTILVDLQLMQDTAYNAGLSALTTEIAATYSKAEHINDRLRRIMEDLVDPTLYDHGLAAALENFISKLSNRYQIRLQTNVERRLDEVVEHVTYRIAQEAITNACNHGIAGNANGQILVTLLESEQRLELRVEDNGCGFDKSVRKPDRLGIYSMERRADELNGRGRLSINSVIGGGTTVIFNAQLTTKTGELRP